MRPMIDDLALPQIQAVRTYDRRALAGHRAPTMDGSLLQNMGRCPACVVLAGVATGADALSVVERLKEKFAAGEAVSFSADIVEDSAIEQMRIDDLRLQELAGKPDRFAYVLTLFEYIEPVEPEDTSLLDGDILEEAGGLLDDLVDGLDIGLDFTTGLERFIGPLTDLLGRLREFNRNVNSSGSP